MLQWDLALGSRDIHVLRDIHDGFLFFRVPTHFQAEIFFGLYSKTYSHILIASMKGLSSYFQGMAPGSHVDNTCWVKYCTWGVGKTGLWPEL